MPFLGRTSKNSVDHFFPWNDMPLLRSLTLVSSLMAINLVIPLVAWAEVASPPTGSLHKAWTFNYALALKKTPSKKIIQTGSIEPGISTDTEPEEQQPGIYSIVIDESVPSYIIHKPILHHSDKTTVDTKNSESQISANDLTSNKDQDAVDASITPSPNIPLPEIFQGNSFPLFPSFERQLTSLQPMPIDSPAISHKTEFLNLTRHSNSLTRFSGVFSPDWEPAAPSQFPNYGTIPLVLNDAVAKNLKYFQEGISDRFQSYLDRFHHYKNIVEPIFREFGLPTELMYLSLVESGFNPKALSHARASGPWQFMKATGRMYKLHVSWYLDERRDPIKSTVAAAHHLRDLYDRFGSWPLALAAYNAGSGKVSRAIRKTGSRDFWKIRRTWYLRRETKDYVPRFIAATLIAKNPTAYGFLEPNTDQHDFEEILIKKPVQLAAITKQTGISLEELKRLNPELRRNIVPKTKGPGYYLKVPVGMATLVASHHETFPVWTQPPPPPTQWYRVRRGDSLSVVARRFRMKVRQLKNMNNLSSNLIRVGTRLRVSNHEDDYVNTNSTWYRVRYGDSLGKIANRFGTSIRQLKKLNKLSTHLIYPGDRLRVKGSPPPKKSLKRGSKWYRVQRGDSLWSIAQQFSVSVRDLRALNNLSSSIIKAGKMLLVRH